MDLSRRQFVILTAAAVAGCRPGETPSPAADERRSTDPAIAATQEQVIDAGALEDYTADGIYTGFRAEGFFIIRRDQRLFALSSVCTHRGCKVRAQRDESFHCRCHGSRFNPEGHVTEGPAEAPLPRLAVALDDGRVLVNLERRIRST